MTATKATTAQQRYQQIVNSDPFLKGDDVHLDLSGHPSLHRPLDEADTSFEDERFSRLSGPHGAASRELKAFLMEQANRPQAANQVNIGKGIVGTVTHDGQQFVCTYDFNGTTQETTGKTRDDAAMAAARFVLNWKPDIRELTDEEIQEVTWLAQSGSAVAAAERYIVHAIPRATELGEQILRDPKFSSTIDAAVLFAWTRSRNDYSLSDKDFPKYLKRYARHKRLTLALLDAAFDAWKHEPSEVEGDPAPEPAIDFEEMDDAEVENTYKAVARASARR
jgi:hypothetical protein